jgi:hypothetical protein
VLDSYGKTPLPCFTAATTLTYAPPPEFTAIARIRGHGVHIFIQGGRYIIKI